MELITWILSNKLTLVEAYFAIIGVASAVVKLTPTLKDDTILKQIISFSGKYLALNRK